MSDYDPYGDARKPSPEETQQTSVQKTERRAGSSVAAKQAPAPSRTDQAKAGVRKVRTMVAQAIWVVCILAAVILALGALCVALKANPDNSLVKWILDTANKLDFGIFERTKDGVYHASGNTHEALTKNAIVNWGIAAVVWLVIGGILSKIVRPKSA
jgi:hypothetical protein